LLDLLRGSYSEIAGTFADSSALVDLRGTGYCYLSSEGLINTDKMIIIINLQALFANNNLNFQKKIVHFRFIICLQCLGGLR